MCTHEKFDEMDERVTNLEAEVAKLRTETRSGFVGLNTAIATLTNQITNMDKRLVEEKEKWGETLRKIVKWTASAALAAATYAAGVNVTATFLH